MPAPAVYVVAAIGAVAAGIAFKQFVYEPHIAPKLEQWAEEFLANRRARRQARDGYGPISVPVHSDDDEHDGHSSSQSRMRQSQLSDNSAFNTSRRSLNGAFTTSRDAIELDNLRQWSAEVDNAQQARLRYRNNAGRASLNNAINESTVLRSPPTHVLVDPSVPSTPSTSPSYRASPAARSTTLETVGEAVKPEDVSSRPFELSARLPTPDPSVTASPRPPAPLSPTRVPSLSEAFPVELDSERGVELLSAPSSRADTPFSSFSNPTARVEAEHQEPFTLFNFSSPNTRSPALESVASPMSQRLSELEFLSDLDEHNMRSPQSVMTDATWEDDDGVGSAAGSDSSWLSAEPRGH